MSKKSYQGDIQRALEIQSHIADVSGTVLPRRVREPQKFSDWLLTQKNWVDQSLARIQ
jgi:hypothetical protein